LVRHLGRRFLDLLVGDALYLQAPFVQEIERLGLDWAFTLKQNQPDLLREAERFSAGPPAGAEPEAGRQVRSHARGPCASFHEFAKRLAYVFAALAPDTS
jgi:hypothetical protein